MISMSRSVAPLPPKDKRGDLRGQDTLTPVALDDDAAIGERVGAQRDRPRPAERASDASAPAPHVEQPGGDANVRVGTMVHKYQIVRALGRGGMGSVYLARDTHLARLVAIKFLDVESPRQSARFIAEAQTTARCNHENIVPMDQAGMRAALTEPLRAVGYRYERPGLVSSMLSELATAPGALPLLQFAAARLWDQRDRDNRLLTVAGYQAMGGIGGALGQHADHVLASMSAAQVKLARWVLERLVTPERTRALVGVTELLETADDLDAVEQVINELADARLLYIESGERSSTIDASGTTRAPGQLCGRVELVHESLISSWPTLLGWLDENRQDTHFLARVRAAARVWHRHGRSDDLLWRGQSAGDARRWCERTATNSGEVGPRERDFLDAVVALATRARRRRRMLVGAGVAVVGVIAVMIALLATRADREAQTRAQAQASEARERVRAAGARNASRLARAALIRPDATWVLALLRDMEPEGPLPPKWREYARWAIHQDIAQVVLIHRNVVCSAAFSPDGTRLITGSFDKTARVWNADGTGEPILLNGHLETVCSASFSPDGARIATASWDKTARVWNADGTGQPVLLNGHRDIVSSADFSPDGIRIVTASRDKTARVWNADGTGKPILLTGHQDEVTSASFGPDGTRIVTTSLDKTARVWNADGTGQPNLLTGHQRPVISAVFSPDGTRIVTASFDETARVWIVADSTGLPIPLNDHKDSVHSAAFSPDSTRIVTASNDNIARVWNADGTGQPILLTGHQDRVTSVAFSPDGTHIVTASYDQTARVWNADGTGVPILLTGHKDAVSSAAFSLDGARIVTASWDQTARVWDADGTGQPILLTGHKSIVTSAAFSPDGTRIVTASLDQTARVWDADGTGQPILLTGHKGFVMSAAFSPDGTRIVTASRDQTARVWNADGTGKPILLTGHQDVLSTAAFSPDGTRIITASHDKTARVWRIDQPKADGTWSFVELRGHSRVIEGGFSPDGTHVLTVSSDSAMRLWNADGTGEPRVWPSFQRLTGIDDPALWTATRFCPSPEEREKLVGKMPAGMAEARYRRCQERVAAAFAAQDA